MTCEPRTPGAEGRIFGKERARECLLQEEPESLDVYLGLDLDLDASPDVTSDPQSRVQRKEFLQAEKTRGSEG